MPDSRRGLIFGALAYILWGTFPLYWTLLEPAGALEILAHRMVWALLAMCVFLLIARRGWSWLPQVLRSPRQLLPVAAAAALISVTAVAA